MCHPMGVMRFVSGSNMSQVVAPAGAMLKRIPRTPAASNAFNSASVTLVFTTATPRVVLRPNWRSEFTSKLLSTP